jgi:hypothetical protein
LTFELGCQVSRLGDSAFTHCSALQSLSLPLSIEMISPSCFNDCPKLTRVVLESGCKLSAESVSALRSTYEVILN